MTRGDLVVMIACGVAGFWAVNAWLGLRSNHGARGERDATDERSRRPAGASPRDGATADHDAAAGTTRPRSDDALGDPEAPATLTNWYRILGVREDADRDTIVAAWRRKVGEYHPDKVARLGPEIRALAERRTQQVNAAYELGMRLFR